MKKFLGAILLTVFFSVGMSTSAQADQMSWYVTGSTDSNVQLKFYSQDYNHSWPGPGKAYEISDYDEHTYTLRCSSGENICYGAWDTSDTDRYWGSGYKDRQQCSNGIPCCAVCGDGDVWTDLTD